jgi:glucose/arabinose dehydrogenase
MGIKRPRRVALAGICTIILVAIPVFTPGWTLPRHLGVRTYARNLGFPVDIAWIRGTSRFFFTERATGKIRVVVQGRLRPRACADLDVSTVGERGPLGLALHPRFGRTKFLYVYYTNRAPLENRVTRFKVIKNRCRRPRHIIRGIPSPSAIHQGGQLEFMNGKLFVSVGDGGNAANAQSLTSRLGKILRYNPNGSIPRGNPFSTRARRNPIWTYGHRNPFGLGARPGTTKLYSSENGPHCDDEVNLIVKGRNYGWGPNYRCGTRGVGPRPKGPLFRWSNTVAPTDITWYSGRIRSLSESLFVGDFNTHRVHRFLLNRRGTRIRAHRVLMRDSRQISSMSKGPGGDLYFSTMVAIRRIVRR